MLLKVFAMGRVGYLARNVGYLTLGQLGTKILSLFLVPLYTYVLTTSEYGTYDLYNTTISLLVPILSFNICDSSLRFPLDKNCNRKDIFSISLYHLFLSILLSAFLIGLNILFDVIPVINDYPLLFFLMFVSIAANGIINNFARGIEKVKEVAISGVICSALIILLNILFLLPMKMGLWGYFLANIIGIIGQVVYLFIAIKGWRYVKCSQLNKKIHKDMLSFSKPLILNNISWWVNGVSNRYVIVLFSGIAANGIFSVSYKIPSVLMMFQGIFSQAWTLSAVNEFEKEDSNVFFSRMYALYNVCMTLICSLLIISSKFIALFLFSKDFYEAWQYVPFLLIATVFGSLSGYIGGIYAAVKDTKAFALTSIYGAIVNLIITFVLVWKIGVMGAAISAAISYFTVWYLRIRSIKHYIKMNISYLRDCLGYIILLIQSICLLIFKYSFILYTIELILFILLLVVHKHLLELIYTKIKDKIRL